MCSCILSQSRLLCWKSQSSSYKANQKNHQYNEDKILLNSVKILAVDVNKIWNKFHAFSKIKWHKVCAYKLSNNKNRLISYECNKYENNHA